MATKMGRIQYSEPESYFPKSIRDKAFGKAGAKKDTKKAGSTAKKGK